MAQYANCFSITTRKEPPEVFVTFYQNHPLTDENGEISNERSTVAEMVLPVDLARDLRAQMDTLLAAFEKDEQKDG